MLTILKHILICWSVASITITQNKVFICKGPSSTVYHRSISCKGLSRCSTQVYGVSITEAKQLGRRACRIEYRWFWINSRPLLLQKKDLIQFLYTSRKAFGLYLRKEYLNYRQPNFSKKPRKSKYSVFTGVSWKIIMVFGHQCIGSGLEIWALKLTFNWLATTWEY